MDISLMTFGSYCKKCKQPIVFCGTDVNKHIECPNCHNRIFVDKDDFVTTYENIKRKFAD